MQFPAGAGDRLIVQGALVANGTLTQTITLTGTVGASGPWGGIYANGTVNTPALVNLNYVNLIHGGVSGSYNAQLSADHAAITVTHSLMQNGGPRAWLLLSIPILISNRQIS